MAQPPKDLAWDDFRLVKAVAEARGLTGAAERLGVNHSTMFRRLGQVEAALGNKLFERHRTGYVLTTAGEERSLHGAITELSPGRLRWSGNLGDGRVTVTERDGRRVLRFQRDDGGGVMELSERAP